MKPPPLAVGFDLDYTLWDADAFFRSFVDAIAGDLGARLGFGPDLIAWAFLGAHRRLAPDHPHLFDEALRELGAWDPGQVEDLVRRYRRHRPPAQLYPGAADLLGALARAGYPLFLVTDGHPATQRHKVEALGLAPAFRTLVFTGDLQPEYHKPSCLPFLQACARLEVEPSRCVFVGDDARRDVPGPRRLGMFTAGVPTGPFAALAASGETPHARLRTLTELEAWL
jgi:putative hydrolase of the HAD superfamily